MQDILQALYHTVDARKTASAETSYVASLLQKGADKIAQKVGEEAVEVVIASTHRDRAAIVAESADLLFHLTVLWHAQGVLLSDIAHELKKRTAISGLEEKSNRSND